MDNRRAVGKAALLIICWGFSFAAVSISLAEEGFFSFFMQVFVPIALIFGYLAMWRIPGAFGKWPLWILAAFFAAVVTLSASFDQVGSVSLITGQKWKALFYFLGRVPAFYMAMLLLWQAMKNHRMLTKEYPAWAYALVIFICWLPYLITVWPGTVSNDSITQLMQVFGLEPLSNANPLFQTGLIRVFTLIGQGIFGSGDVSVALYILVQGLLMAWLFGSMVAMTAKGGTPAWLTLLSLLFYALCPIFPLFAWCVGKDTNFAMAVLWLMLIILRMTRSEQATRRDKLSLSIAAVLCVLLRNAGIGLAIITLTVLLIWSLRRHNAIWQGTLYALTTVLCVVFVWHAAVIPWLEAGKSPVTEILSAPLQQVARVAANESLDDEYTEAINAVLPVDELKSAYIGGLSDPVKNLWLQSATTEEKIAFFSAWLHLGLKHPVTYASAFYHNSYGYITPGFVSTIKPAFLLGAQGNTEKLSAKFTFTVNPRAEIMKAALKRLLTYAPFRILCAPGLYGWIALFAMTIVCMTRQRRMLLCMLPVLLALLGCLFSPVNGYFRYAMPVYFAAPLLMMLAARAIRKSDPIAL
ncbi:MAG TPA: DUF6020 family protein [Candidatus Limiplasma sp.]|nr:DUF6020 family protein [Candidatus Limiplasma sp.]